MRIALISQEYPPETAHGGIGTQTYMKAHGLRSLGHEVHVISHSLDDRIHEYIDDDVSVTRIPGYDRRLEIHAQEVRWLTYSVEVASAVDRLNRKVPLDVVDFPEWGAEGYVHLLNQNQWNRMVSVVHLHGPLVMFAHAMGWPDKDSVFYRVGSAMEATCLHLADRVFSSSRCSAEWCSSQYGIDLSNAPIIHSGVDTSIFRPLDVKKSSQPTIMFTGKIVANKGVHVLLEAALQLAAEVPGLRLRMLGTGEAAVIRGLQRTAAERGRAEMLDLVGFVAREHLPEELASAHVFAAPSIYEGGPGFVYLEAMACGVPVIACEGSGAAEVVLPESNGLLVPAGDVGALVAALRRLLLNPMEREAMGLRALEFARREADSELCAKRLEAFYHEVIAAPPGS